jgi:peptide/nickel transport system substrate-binding protein
LAIGPVSPAFKWAYNDSLRPYPYDPTKAKELLKEEGWEDHNGDGVLDKGGRKFSFKLRTNSGNPRRAYAGVIIQNNLKAIGIDVEIEQLETNVFLDGLRKKRFDAFLSGFSVPLEMDFESFFGSELDKDTFNTASFRNKRVDEIFSASRNVVNVADAAPLWKEFQSILYEEQPITFLYWIDRLVGVNNRLQGTSVSILGALTDMGSWYLTPTVTR